MYGEDIDLSYRLIKGGWQNWYLPYDIIHYKGESTQKTSFRYVHVFYQAMLIFFRKHYDHLSFFFSLPIQVAIYFRAFLALIQIQSSRLHHFINPRHDAYEQD
jgi:GT2 family glycosyltransferase